MSALPRHHRAEAARALAGEPRRAQLAWDDLAAWPAWAAADDAALQALARRAGAWLHAAALQRCIHGALLQRVRQHLGDEAFARLLAAPGEAAAATSPCSGLPSLPQLDDWLQAQGTEALLASVPSAPLRVLLRERIAPGTLPPLGAGAAPDTAAARVAVQQALS